MYIVYIYAHTMFYLSLDYSVVEDEEKQDCKRIHPCKYYFR